MPEFKTELSVKSLDKLLSNVRGYGQKVKQSSNKMVELLAQEGQAEIQRNIDDISDKDGNVLAQAGAFTFGSSGFVYLYGDQAAFLEYGTGYEGKTSPHPMSQEAGWEYLSGSTIRETADGKYVWKYRMSGGSQWRYTHGIPAQMPVLKAATRIRAMLPGLVKEAIR